MARKTYPDPEIMLSLIVGDILSKFTNPLMRTYAHFLNFVKRFPDYITAMVVLYVATFTIVLPYLCSNMTYSAYFSPATDNDGLIKKATDLNNERIVLAEKYFERLSRSGNRAYYSELSSQANVDLVIGVVTTKRYARGALKLNYLSQVMAKLDKIVKEDQNFPHKVLFICSVYPGPGNHSEALQMADYFAMYNKFPQESPADTISDPFDKEKEDYIYCLQQALYFDPKWIVMIEDDAIPNEEILFRLKKVIDGQRDPYLNAERDFDTRPWAYLKLFYPERWQGYSFDNGVGVIELISVSLIGGFLFLIAFHVHLAKCRTSRVHRHQPDEYFVFSIGFMYFGIFASVIGRQYWLWFLQSLSHYHTVPAPDCCSPAILYETGMAQDIISYLASITCSSKLPLDLAMAQFTNENTIDSLLIEPNLVKHIGMFSSIKSTIPHPEDFTF